MSDRHDQLEAELLNIRRRMRRLTATNVVLGVVVLAFGGAGAAYALAPANSVNSAAIIDRTIGTPDVKVGAFAGQTILDNSMTNLDIKDGTIRAEELAANAVTSAKVLLDTLTSADLANNSVGSAEIATGSVQDDEVSAGTLNADDVSSNTGSFTYDPPALAAGECDTHLVAVDADTSDDITLATPDSTINPLAASGRVTFWTQQSSDNDKFRYNFCNISNAAIAAGDIPLHTVFYMAFDRGVGASSASLPADGSPEAAGGSVEADPHPGE